MVTAQAPYGLTDHDSYQVHAFCPGLVAAARVFKTNTFHHVSAWIWRDGGALSEVLNDERPLVQGSVGHLDLTGDGVRITAPDGECMLETPSLRFQYTPRTELRWPDTISDVIHQPDMEMTVHVDGESHAGIGYVKRYTWTPHPHYWGYRFIQGYADDNRINLWTAEATFGEAQYDYMKILRPDGSLAEAGPWQSCHRDNGARGVIDGQEVQVSIEELGRWEAPLRSDGMDSLMRQRACRLTVDIDGTRHQGMAINENCFGTLG